jgi:hypothetical protein
MDATEHVKFNVGRRETWDERLHKIKETTTDELRLSKYRCPYFYCYGGGRPILRSSIRAHFRNHGHDSKLVKPLLVHCSIFNKNLFV